jgi:SSS family transporter
MSPSLILIILLAYFGVLMLIGRLTARDSGNDAFFLGQRRSPWYVVAFGMVGASLSGVTFISIPGAVGGNQFSYFQVVLGYVLGYVVIAFVLLPLYYRLNLTSIYTYLAQRFGWRAHRTGAGFFLLSRTVGAAFRLFLVALVLHEYLLAPWGLRFEAAVLVTVGLIYLYTFRGGIRTIVWTDTLQTFFMLLTAVFSLRYIGLEMEWGFSDMVAHIQSSSLSRTFFWSDWRSEDFFVKQFLSGAFITIVMTGLDQDMMQKNLSCRNEQEARKNMLWLSGGLVLVNLLFLGLGALLHLYAEQHQIALPERSDRLFPMLALEYFGPLAGLAFVLGLTAAAYSSADSALTSLTTSFCVDFLGMGRQDSGPRQRRIRYGVHIGFALVLCGVIIGFHALNNQAVIMALFKAAGYTYGPLLGMFAFGLLSRRPVRDQWTPVVAALAPVLCFVLDRYSETWLFGYQFGFELLMVNGLLTFLGMWLVSRAASRRAKAASAG